MIIDLHKLFAMSVLIRQLALVSQSKVIPPSDVMKVSAALQKQVTRDLSPIWEISATVDSLATLADVPPGYWPLIVEDDINTPGAAGIHKDDNGQPLALISASADINVWSLTASHETLEMLVDPSGNRLVAGDSPKADQGRVSFLVEVCDPSEASDYAYSVNGVLVSDFYTPHYFDPVKASGVRYSFSGAISEPRQVLRGGYLSWIEPVSGQWWQETWFDGDQSTFRNIGPISQKAHGDLRTAIDGTVMDQTIKAIGRGRTVAGAAGLTSAAVSASSTAYADAWRMQIAALRRGSAGEPRPPKAGRRAAPSVRHPE